MKVLWIKNRLIVLSTLMGIILIATTFNYSRRTEVLPENNLCPSGEGIFIPPRTYKQKYLFLGYDGDDYHLGFIRSVVKSVVEQELGLDVNILIPRGELDLAYEKLAAFRKPPYNTFVNLVLAPSDDSLWIQDYIEAGIDLQSNEMALIELPYWGRDGSVMPKFIALSKRWDFISAPAYPEGEDHENGDYGGNIEALPFGQVLIGEVMAETLKSHLKKIAINQKFIQVPVGWLENSHVDEVFTLIPTTKSACGFVIGYASPSRAIEILQSSPPTGERIMPQFDYEEDLIKKQNGEILPEDIFKGCLVADEFPKCEELIRANYAYQEKIESGLEIIRAAMGPMCPSLQFIPFPQLYMPSQIKEDYGTHEDLANALNPSLVNNLLVGQHVYYSWQPYSVFAKEAYHIYQSLGLVPRPVVSNVLHHSKGGLHCASLMVYTCTKR